MLPVDFCLTAPPELLAALETEPPTSVRLHPLRTCALEGSEIPWSPYGRYLAERPCFTLDPAFHAGAYYVQEASSQFLAWLLPPASRVLDLCAAPGGKTTLYSSTVGSTGLVVANEVVRSRANVLADNARKWGLGNIAVTSASAERFAALPGFFDVVAVDAPCSGEGMFRKDINARSEWSLQAVSACAARQKNILNAVWPALQEGGTLIYSTCTFNRTENEEVLAAFSEGLAAAAIPEPPAQWGIECGETGPWRTFRFFPHKVKGEGFFVAIAQKTTGAPRPGKPGKTLLTPVREATLSRWLEPEMQLAKINDTYYAFFPSRFDDIRQIAAAVPVIASGIELGQLLKGALKPAHALAQFTGLRNQVATAEIDPLPYLRKSVLSPDGLSEGLNLITCQGLPLGWAKRIGARVNNLYPDPLRIQRL